MQSFVWNVVWRRCRPRRSIWVLRRMGVTMSRLEREMTTMPSGLGSSGRFNNRWGSLFSLLLFSFIPGVSFLCFSLVFCKINQFLSDLTELGLNMGWYM